MINSLVVIAKITPKSAHYDDAKAALMGILPQTRSETGCHQFLLSENLGDGCLYLYEEWEDQAALNKHYDQPYVAAVFESYGSWLSRPVDITKLTRVA